MSGSHPWAFVPKDAARGSNMWPEILRPLTHLQVINVSVSGDADLFSYDTDS